MGVEAIIGGGLGLLGGSKSKKGAQSASRQLAEAYAQAQTQYLEQMSEVFTALAEGKAEAADGLMEQIGMGIEERKKFFDIALNETEWIVDFGKEGIADVNWYSDRAKGLLSPDNKYLQRVDQQFEMVDKFMNHYSELIFNPDAIFDTEVYNQIKDRTVSEWQNQYAATGILSGNAQAAVADRVADMSYNFLRGERQDALSGAMASDQFANTALGVQNTLFNQALSGQSLGLQQVGMGANASLQRGAWANATGQDILGARVSAGQGLAAIAQAFNAAPYLSQQAGNLFQGALGLAGGQANLGLAGSQGFANTLSNLGGNLLFGGLLGNILNPGTGGTSLGGGGGSGGGIGVGYTPIVYPYEFPQQIPPGTPLTTRVSGY